jgi:hypothetical protein
MFESGASHVGFEVYKRGTGTQFLLLLQFLLPSIAQTSPHSPSSWARIIGQILSSVIADSVLMEPCNYYYYCFLLLLMEIQAAEII